MAPPTPSPVTQLDGQHDVSDMDNSDDSESINESGEINGIKDENGMRFLLTNARSLKQKTAALTDAFQSLDLNFAGITETWFKGGKALTADLAEYEGSTGIRILHRSRDGRKKGNGGGVAIAFNIGCCNFKQRHLESAKKFEIICAVGRVGKINRKIVTFTVYIPPSMRAPEFAELKEALGVEISAVKCSLGDPVILVMGDFNHRDISGVLNMDDVQLVPTAPTRGLSTIDRIYTNAHDQILDVRVLPPLQSSNGVMSDHRCVFVDAVFPPLKKYEWIVQYRRTRDEARERAFAEEMSGHNWANLCGDVNEMVDYLQKVVAELSDKHFPLVRLRRRSNELPWITKRIRKLWKRKVRLYKKKGRSDAWWETDRRLQECIEEARCGFVDRMLEDGNRGRSFYAATKKLAVAAPSKQWSVSDMFPGMSPAGVCNEVLGYYGGIAGDATGPMPEVARCTGGLGDFSIARTTSLLKSAKKSDSRVDGDPLAHLVRRYPEAFAAPVSAIYKKINEEGFWPKQWKTEHLTIIPKNPNPADLSECRNISCTSIFSKILEGVILRQLRDEICQDDGQYGGTPKCGAEHMLVDIWEKVLSALEGGQNAAVLLGVDYEKAFNRMEHAACIEELRRLGASDGSIALVRAFLENRTMVISIDGQSGTPVHIRKGSPQGSVLGCFLYCITTQSLTVDLRGVRDATAAGPASFLYVDDTTLFDQVPMSEAARHITTGRTQECFGQLALEDDFRELGRRATDIGMKINEKKTQLLVISPPNGCNTGASLSAGNGVTIASVEKLRLVGFTFGSDGGAGEHVGAIEDMFRRKKWMLYHLRDAGLKGAVLFGLYCCYIRSSIEYCSAAYHSLLNAGQAERLESLHRHAIRTCFGHHREVEEVMAEFNIETLEQRRIRRCDAFIRKAASNPRFNRRWFPPREGERPGLRSRREIQESQATSLRRFNSPLLYMRRRANEIGVMPVVQ